MQFGLKFKNNTKNEINEICTFLNYRMLNGCLPQVSQCSDKPFTDAESYADVNEF